MCNLLHTQGSGDTSELARMQQMMRCQQSFLHDHERCSTHCTAGCRCDILQHALLMSNTCNSDLG